MLIWALKSSKETNFTSSFATTASHRRQNVPNDEGSSVVLNPFSIVDAGAENRTLCANNPDLRRRPQYVELAAGTTMERFVLPWAMICEYSPCCSQLRDSGCCNLAARAIVLSLNETLMQLAQKKVGTMYDVKDFVY